MFEIDSDNGSEFINNHFLPIARIIKLHLQEAGLTKRMTHVLLSRNELYGYLRLYINFFIPVRKCLSKTREGSKIKKNYDESKTPYRRVLECGSIDDKIKTKLRKVYDGLNPAELKRKITGLQDKLLKLNALKQQVLKDSIGELKSPFDCTD